ncbi:MAG: LPS-assembly protein LptD [Alphaproteobacteria bacterium]|nr:LPS-assembly protein LptD [Alphaproteobacteria bacterium]
MVRRGTPLLRMRRALPGQAASKASAFFCLHELALAGAIALLAVAIAPWQQAYAQKQTELEQIIQPPQVDTAEPMLLQADEMIYDNENARVTARGNVEIYYGNYTLLADRVVYSRATNTLRAEGNVRIKDSDGAVITSEQITLTDDFRDGFIDALKLVTQDETRIVAQTASREAGNVTVFQKGWFTPCKLCEDRPDKPPTWRIRAGKITHKRDQATITFRNAAFDFFGVPLIWTPWFQMADPTVKRKSGFLMPSYSHSDELGSTVQVPYYFALSDHYDFTFAPMWTQKAGTLLQGNWRHRLAPGAYSIDLAGVWDDGSENSFDDSNADNEFNGEFRGSVKSKGRFALNPYWAYGWDVLFETDDTFRRYYNLDSRLKTDRISQLYLEGLHDRNYLSTRFYNTQSLVPGQFIDSDNLTNDTDDPQETVYPIIDYDYIVNKPILGGELSFTSNAMMLTSDANYSNKFLSTAPLNNKGVNHIITDTSRMITEVNWRRQMIDGIGQVFTPFGRLRGDIYGVSNDVNLDANVGIVDNTVFLENNPLDDGTFLRGNAVAGMEYRYPFIAYTRNIAHVLEPIGQIIVRPNSVGDQFEIPNEDALSLIYDDTILFDIDKFSGFDRIETGTRANVGARYTAQFAGGAYVRAVAGQSYQLAGQNPFDTAFYDTTGLETADSDYVTGIYIQANANLSFSAQSRFDEETLDIERTDLGTWARYGPAQFRVNYADVTEGTPGLGLGEFREEIVGAGVLALTDDWSVLGNLRYDITADQRITDGLGLRYQDDCFMLDVTYQRSFIKDQDIEPDQRFLVNFMLKYLGTYQFSTDTGDVFGGDGTDTN